MKERFSLGFVSVRESYMYVIGFRFLESAFVLLM